VETVNYSANAPRTAAPPPDVSVAARVGSHRSASDLGVAIDPGEALTLDAVPLDYSGEPQPLTGAPIAFTRCIHCNGTGMQVQRVRLSEANPTGNRVACHHCRGVGGVAPIRSVSVGEFIGARLVFAARYACALGLLYLAFQTVEYLYRWIAR